jgi:ferrochelatase
LSAVEPSLNNPKGHNIGVLLVNLGTPDTPTPTGVRIFLREFLSDRRVIDAPKLIWLFVLNCIILLVRPAKVARLYKAVWTDEGSPLLAIGKQQEAALQALLAERVTQSIKVVLAMTYGRPSISQGLEKLKASGYNRVLVLPLYPQYSGTTTAAIFDAVANALKDVPDLPELRFVNSYADRPDFVSALKTSVETYWAERGRPDRLLMSFHGIPKKYADKGDPYIKECYATADLLAKSLALETDQWACTFQSRFGPAEWVKPYTDDTLLAWGKEGVKRVDVICPAFTADCLETLEEIAIQNKEVFIEAGGGDYHYIPALNASPEFIACLTGMVEQHTKSW